MSGENFNSGVDSGVASFSELGSAGAGDDMETDRATPNYDSPTIVTQASTDGNDDIDCCLYNRGPGIGSTALMSAPPMSCHLKATNGPCLTKRGCSLIVSEAPFAV